MVRGNGYQWQQTLQQIATQPPGTLAFLGVDEYIDTTYNKQNQYNFAWIGRDNLVYMSQLGAQSAPVPVFDCNNYQAQNPDGTFQRLTDGSCPQCFNGNCCDFSSGTTNSGNLCHYPIILNGALTNVNACLNYNIGTCPAPAGAVNMIMYDVNGNPTTFAIKALGSTAGSGVSLATFAPGDTTFQWLFEPTSSKIILASNPSVGIGATTFPTGTDTAPLSLVNADDAIAWSLDIEDGVYTFSVQ
jgi:hypothetical protein